MAKKYKITKEYVRQIFLKLYHTLNINTFDSINIYITIKINFIIIIFKRGIAELQNRAVLGTKNKNLYPICT